MPAPVRPPIPRAIVRTTHVRWATGALLGLTGCGLDLNYYLGLAGGALTSLARTRPIELVLADPRVDEATKSKLRFVLEVRQFGIDEIGLRAGAAYTFFDDDLAATGGRAVGYSVSGSAREAFVPYTWDFPFVGRVEYKGFLDRAAAERERDALADAGYDVYLGPIAGFSTLGLLADSIRSSQLRSDEIDLALLILHELTHGTVYKSSDTLFNETLAQFVGRSAARRFFQMRRNPESEQAAAALRRYGDEDLIDAYLGRLFDDLAAYYALPLSRAEKIAGRQAEFDRVAATFDAEVRPRLSDPDRYRRIADLELNNAVILAAARYRGDLEVYGRLLERVGGDFRAAWPVLRDAAAQADGFAYLEQWLDATP